MIKTGSFSIAFCSFLVILFASCGPSKKVHDERLYLKGIDSIRAQSYKIPDPIIQQGDLLSINVYSDDQKASSFFNQPPSAGVEKSPSGANEISSSAAAPVSGGSYLVDVQGNIRFFALGLLHVEGLNKAELVKLLQDKLLQYLKNPYVEIRFLSARVTVMGEVMHPGTLNLPEQKISILDAIALSGDLTVYGRRDNILVIREKNGKRESARVDVHSPNVFQSEYFYLQQNDLVIVEPVRKKPSGSDQVALRNVTIATSIISSLAILISLFK